MLNTRNIIEEKNSRCVMNFDENFHLFIRPHYTKMIFYIFIELFEIYVLYFDFETLLEEDV